MRALFTRNGVGPTGWVWNLMIGPGAGYIGGRTAFVAWRSGSLRWNRQYRRTSRPPGHTSWRQGRWRIGCLEFGWTGDANIVPYTSH